jgi:hypothetical protein
MMIHPSNILLCRNQFGTVCSFWGCGATERCSDKGMVTPAGNWPDFTSSVFAAVHHAETVTAICSRENSTGMLFHNQFNPKQSYVQLDLLIPKLKKCILTQRVKVWSTVFIIKNIANHLQDYVGHNPEDHDQHLQHQENLRSHYCLIAPHASNYVEVSWIVLTLYWVLFGSELCSPAGRGTGREEVEWGKVTEPVSKPLLIRYTQLISTLKICLCSEKLATDSLCSVMWTGSALGKLHSCLVMTDKY